jgi:integrase
MASIWRHPNSRYFTACFRDQNGRQRRITTKSTDRRKAAKIADSFEKVAREKRTRTHVLRVIAQLHEEIGGQPICRTSLREFATSWLVEKEASTVAVTSDFYRASVAKLLRFLGERAEFPINEITKQDLLSYRKSLIGKVSAKTINHDFAAIRMLFRSARKEDVIEKDPAETIAALRTARNGASSARRAFTLDELRTILSVADDEWRSMILVGLYSGQRLSDVGRLTWENVDLERGEIRLVTSKTGKRLIIPLATPLLRHLESMGSSDNPRAPLHPRAAEIIRREGKSSTLSRQFAELLSTAGLRLRKSHQGEGKGRSAVRESHGPSFHSLRRTATTLLHEAGVPAAVCQALIGHDSEAMHELYVKVGHEALQKAAAALPEL